MSTFMANPQNVERKWYVIDATGKPLGRGAVAAASILNGKNKPTYTPHVDCGDHVIIINCEKAVLTGNKLNNKVLRWHTGWIGHLKEYKYSDMMAKEPERAMKIAVEGMLPTTPSVQIRLRDFAFTRVQSILTLLSSLKPLSFNEGGRNQCTNLNQHISMEQAAESILSPESAFIRAQAK